MSGGLKPAVEQPGDADEHVAVPVSAARKSQQRDANPLAARKQPLKVSGGTKPDKAFRQAWRRVAGDLSEAEQRRGVLQALEVFRQLPPSSSYAQHRIRVLEKALELLDKSSEVRSAEEQNELQKLLGQLKL